MAQPQGKSSQHLLLSEVFHSNRLLPLSILAGGFVLRLIPAERSFLNPDEALHYCLASQSSLVLAYKAALTNAHPPLLILLLYYWRALGQSELILRLLSILAGTAFCWITFRWLEKVSDRTTALIGLMLVSFAPSLILLSAEIRQYPLLLLFIACSLYFSELAIRRNSRLSMVLFSFALYGALLSHYSSYLFALAMAIYLLVRLYPYGRHLRLFGVWVAGQLGALAICIFFVVTHIPHLQNSGMVEAIADTWLRKSIFHHGERNLVAFIVVQTLRVFTYLSSQGAIGTVALLVFLLGVGGLLRRKQGLNPLGPTSRLLALLLGLPFIINCGLAIAGLYPYGGTRHNAFLAPFAITGICMGIAVWKPSRAWIKALIVVLALSVCNLFPAPGPPIRPKNQSKLLMAQAAEFLRKSLPAGSILFSDYESALLLGYYFCGHSVVQTFAESQHFLKSGCGPDQAIVSHDAWVFRAEDFASQLQHMAETYGLKPGSKVWLFHAGWIIDTAPQLREKLRQFGCPWPQGFGENILVCQLTVSSASATANSTLQSKPQSRAIRLRLLAQRLPEKAKAPAR